MAVEKGIRAYDECTNSLLDQDRKGLCQFTLRAGVKDEDLLSDRASGVLHLPGLSCGLRITRVHEHCDQGHRADLAQQFESLGFERHRQYRHVRDSAAGPIET